MELQGVSVEIQQEMIEYSSPDSQQVFLTAALPTPTWAFVAEYETDDQIALDSQQEHLDVGGHCRRRIHVGCPRRGGPAKRQSLRPPGT